MKYKFSNLLFCLFLLPYLSSDLLAQQAHVNLDWDPQKNKENLVPFMTQVISPEVFDDHIVIFRVSAPEAQKVELSGSILLELGAEGAIPFKKSEEGIWTLKVGPMTPEIYYYKINIDGVSVVDPSNTFTGFANQAGYSILIVHGDGPAFYDAKNVPHGVVGRVIYHSDVTDGEREMFVYTPPGYDESKEYPVLYLMGGSGEVASTWSLFGRVNFIMDNLLAEGKVLPMIIAMPNNQMLHRMDPNHTELTFDLTEKELLTEVIPYIESNYSVKADKHYRALSGLSMGGRHTQVVGLNNLDVFGSFGILSAAVDLDMTPAVKEPGFNDKVDYLFVGAGTNETTPESRQEVLHNQLTELGVDHVYYIGSRGAHDFVTWRHLLYYQFLPNLWKSNK